MIARYLNSSIEHIEQIEILFDVLGYAAHRLDDRHRALAERARVPAPAADATVPAWLRLLPPSDANRVIDALQADHDVLMRARGSRP